MKNIPVYLGLIVMLITSCGGVSKTEYDALLAENDSLRNAKAQLERELNAYNTINDTIEQCQGTLENTGELEDAVKNNESVSTRSSSEPVQNTATPTSMTGDKEKYIYRVQLFALSQKKDVELFNVPNLKVKETNGVYKYYLGDYSTREEADKEMEKYKSQFPAAITLAIFKNE